MSKTTIYFLNKNRQIDQAKIKAKIGIVDHNEGVYVVNPAGINGIRSNRKMKRGSEIFFFEGNCDPIPLKKPKATTDKTKDASRRYLNDMVYVNFLEQTGDPALNRFKDRWKFIKPLMNPATLFKVIFFLVIAGSLVYGTLQGLWF